MNNENKDRDIFDTLKGYFPEKYDLTPEELEKQIVIEEKQRAIALGMLGEKEVPKKPAPKAPVKPQEAPSEIIVKEIATETAKTTDEAETPKNDSKAEIQEIPAPEIEIEEPVPTPPVSPGAEPPVVKKENGEEEIIVPDADSVENNVLYNDMSSLNDLFNEMDTGDEEIDYSDEEEVVETKGHKIVNWLFDFVEVFTICLLAIILIFSFFFRLTRVDGSSMTDTLKDGEYLVVTNFMYTPQVGDIVVLQNTSLDHPQLKEPLVKRVIAKGGQSVDIAQDGSVTITEADGSRHELEQDYIKKEIYGGVVGHWNVPDGMLFVMGDNRNGSTDSRYQVGFVDERCIFGHAILRILPFNTFTVFSNPYSK